MITSRLLISAASHTKQLLSKNSIRALSGSTQLIDNDMNEATKVATISFNRPPMSSFSLELLEEFSKALDDANGNENCNGIILTSKSPSVFSAGLDVKELINPDIDRLRAIRGAYLDCCTKLYGSFLPTAALVNGHAIGGGCFFAMLTEYRVMMKGFKIGLNETQLGIAMPEVSIEVTKNIISARQTEIALTQGTIFTTEEAFEIGLIDEISSDKNESIEKCLKFLNRYKNIPKEARALTKQNFRKKVLDLFNADRERDIENFVNFTKSEATQKTLKAFLNSSKK